ncbi:hypothetical protein KDA11_03360 [Candidatus Saccharibacteria bacterium]|nr:hypothetical protein [Candidatus Saccharibacteria bacterium]
MDQYPTSNDDNRSYTNINDAQNQIDPTVPVITNISKFPTSPTRLIRGTILFSISILLVVIIGFGGLWTYKFITKDPTSVAQTEYSDQYVDTTISANADQQSTNNVMDSDAQSGSTGSSNGSLPQSSPVGPVGGSSGSQSVTVNCGVSGMPEGVCTIIQSIEKDGLRNNPYIASDTSQVPANGVVKVNASSWTNASSDAGTVNFTATFGDLTYNGQGNLALVNGSWKVVGYTLN